MAISRLLSRGTCSKKGEVRNMVGVTYQEIHLFVEFLKKQYGQGRPDYIEALNDLDGLVEVSYREAIERFLEDEVR